LFIKGIFKKKEEEMEWKKGQVGLEYLLIVGLVTFVIIAIMLVAMYYSGMSKDLLNVNQIESFGNKVTSTAETVFYYGSPSRVTLTAYLPEGVNSIEIIENSVVITADMQHGSFKMAFESRVPIQGDINSGAGLKKIKLEALEDSVLISSI